MKWFYVCNDYSLEEIKGEGPNLKGFQSLEIEGGTVYGEDLEEEGPLYYFGEGTNDCYLGGFE